MKQQQSMMLEVRIMATLGEQFNGTKGDLETW